MKIRSKAILDKETGNPVEIEIKKSLLNEINQNPGKCISKQDSIEFVAEKGKEFEIKKATNEKAKNILKSAIDGIGRIFQNKKLDEPINSKIERLTSNKEFLKRKNPYDDPKYAKEIVRLRYEGIYQTEFDEGLKDFANSEQGKFLSYRLVPNEKMTAKQNGQMNRMTMMSFMIAKDEGLLNGEDSEKQMEYLLNSVSDTVLNKKIEISKDDEKKIWDCVKEAEILDRARLCVKTPFGSKTKVEPKTLKLKGAKKLMEFTYGLECLSSEVGDFRGILSCKEPKNETL